METISFEYTLHERMRCVRSLNGWSLFFLTLFFVACLRFDPSFGTKSGWWLVVPATLFCVVAWGLRRAYILSEPYRGIRDLEFGYGEISLRSGAETIQARSLVDFDETWGGFSLKLPGETVLFVPKRIFHSENELESFRECASGLVERV